MKTHPFARQVQRPYNYLYKNLKHFNRILKKEQNLIEEIRVVESTDLPKAIIFSDREKLLSWVDHLILLKNKWEQIEYWINYWNIRIKSIRKECNRKIFWLG